MNTNKPIINSLLDLDYYKLTMGQIAFFLHRMIVIVFEFKNRTKKIRLAEIIPIEVLREQLQHVTTLRFGAFEIHYLKRLGFRDSYLRFLESVQLPMPSIEVIDGQYIIRVKGPWPIVIFWETLWLSIVNELYYRYTVGDLEKYFPEGERRLLEKIDPLNSLSEWTNFIEFGTRRRFCREWQRRVLEICMDAKVPMIGTSNVSLAMELGLDPKGTMAHEEGMVYSGIYHDEDDAAGTFVSHEKMLDDWFDFYGEPLSIALTDTYGSQYFFRTFGEERARKWRGPRQDSADPFAFGEFTIDYYRGYGIDPASKLWVPSDGLNCQTIVELDKRFRGRIHTSAGWGTTMTNDMGLPTLSIVAKAVEANGYGTVKLSDNIAKATGTPDDIARAKLFVGYTGNNYQECLV